MGCPLEQREANGFRSGLPHVAIFADSIGFVADVRAVGVDLADEVATDLFPQGQHPIEAALPAWLALAIAYDHGLESRKDRQRCGGAEARRPVSADERKTELSVLSRLHKEQRSAVTLGGGIVAVSGFHADCVIKAQRVFEQRFQSLEVVLMFIVVIKALLFLRVCCNRYSVSTACVQAVKQRDDFADIYVAGVAFFKGVRRSRYGSFLSAVLIHSKKSPRNSMMLFCWTWIVVFRPSDTSGTNSSGT